MYRKREKTAMAKFLKKYPSAFNEETNNTEQMSSLPESLNLRLIASLFSKYLEFSPISFFPDPKNVERACNLDQMCCGIKKKSGWKWCYRKGLGRLTEFHNNKVTCNLDYRQKIYLIVKEIRAHQKELSSSNKERFTKKSVVKKDYKSLWYHVYISFNEKIQHSS